MKDSSKRYAATQQYWEEIYRRNAVPTAPSSFALWCLSSGYISETSTVVDLGCGNGRDSFKFIDIGASVLGVDACDVAISVNQKRLMTNVRSSQSLFVTSDITKFSIGKNSTDYPFLLPTVIYSRFFLHAIPENVQTDLLSRLSAVVHSGCMMLHEFRTVKDPLFKQGLALGDREKFTDHYRRFIVLSDLIGLIEGLGWRVLFSIEEAGLARLGDDDPVVGRLVAIKR